MGATSKVIHKKDPIIKPTFSPRFQCIISFHIIILDPSIHARRHRIPLLGQKCWIRIVTALPRVTKLGDQWERISI